MRMQEKKASTTLVKTTLLTPKLFTQLDKDGNGTIDLDELKSAVDFTSSSSVRDLFERADLNGDGQIDYAEYERLMNMELYEDGQGGNIYVRQALDLGLLKKGSVLEDCVMVGNKGFDPLNLATSMEKLNEYREAELKHCRLAMLAAVGWPFSEYAQPLLSKQFGAENLLAGGEKAPSILNGGLDKINPLFFMAIILFTATIESVALKATPNPDRLPGDLGFDPLGLYYGKTEDVKRDYELKEIQNGRLAMIAVVGFVAEEVVTGLSTLQETPVLLEKIPL
jgi:hypothetical protein